MNVIKKCVSNNGGICCGKIIKYEEMTHGRTTCGPCYNLSRREKRKETNSINSKESSNNTNPENISGITSENENKLILSFNSFKLQTEERFNNIEGKFNNIEEKFNNIEEKFNNIENRFNKIEENFNNIEGKFNNIEERFNKIEERFNELEAQNLINYKLIDKSASQTINIVKKLNKLIEHTLFTEQQINTKIDSILDKLMSPDKIQDNSFSSGSKKKEECKGKDEPQNFEYAESFITKMKNNDFKDNKFLQTDLQLKKY